MRARQAETYCVLSTENKYVRISLIFRKRQTDIFYNKYYKRDEKYNGIFLLELEGKVKLIA